MAKIAENMRRVVVEVSQEELNKLLIEPAIQAGYIDFTPTRIHTKPMPRGGFAVSFERVGAEPPAEPPAAFEAVTA